MGMEFPLHIGDVYELLPYPDKDCPFVALAGGRIVYFNGLEELELDGEILRLHFPHTTSEFRHIEKQRWKFIGKYGEEEPVE